jgi:hypothetical protein
MAMLGSLRPAVHSVVGIGIAVAVDVAREVTLAVGLEAGQVADDAELSRGFEDDEGDEGGGVDGEEVQIREGVGGGEAGEEGDEDEASAEADGLCAADWSCSRRERARTTRTRGRSADPGLSMDLCRKPMTAVVKM